MAHQVSAAHAWGITLAMLCAIRLLFSDFNVVADHWRIKDMTKFSVIYSRGSCQAYFNKKHQIR